MRRTLSAAGRLGIFRLCLGLIAISMLAAAAAAAAPLAPGATDRVISRSIVRLIKREHVSKHPLDDEISQRALNLFLKALDGRKQYFLQSDVAEFEKSKNELDDLVNNGDVAIAYKIFNLLLERMDQRVKQIDDLLKEDFDFEQDEVLSMNWEKLPYPKDDAEAKDRWRKLLKNDLLVLKTDKADQKKENPKERLSRRYHSMAKRMHQMDGDELLELFLTSITSSYDPHTTYMSPGTLENFRIMMRLNLDGIGAELRMEDGYTTINKVVVGGAAEKQGQLKVQDRIAQVGQGEEGEMVDVVDLRLNDVVKLIRGKAGTIVRLGVIPATGGEIKIIKITRAKIELGESAARGIIIEDGQRSDGKPYKIGVINLPSFYMDMEAAHNGGAFKSASVDVKRILDDFNKNGVDALVLDLRINGGGSLIEAVNLTGLFIDEGPVVQVKNNEGHIEHHDDTDRGMAWKGPMVVLTSKFSASASEILAGAIQDYHRGLIVGDSSTHGKGTVQSLLDLGERVFAVAKPQNLGALKLTMQQFYRPNGDSTQKRGVLADIVLPSIIDHMDVSETDLDYALEFDKVPAATYNKLDLTPPKLIAELKDFSKQRVEKSADFAKLAKNIARYDEQKKKKEIPLNEKKYLARRAELDSEKEDEKTFEEQQNGTKEVFKRDFYSNETLAITLDYLRLLNKDKVAGVVEPAR